MKSLPLSLRSLRSLFTVGKSPVTNRYARRFSPGRARRTAELLESRLALSGDTVGDPEDLGTVSPPEGQFSQASVQGPYGFSFDGFATFPSAAGPIQVPISAVGHMIADGQGNVTQATRTLNLGGAVILEQTATGTYQVQPDGTGTASFVVTLAASPTILFEPPFPLALPPATLETFSFVIDATTKEIEFMGISIQDVASGTPLLPVSTHGAAQPQSASGGVSLPSTPGDANRDGRFDQFDIITVLSAGKYLSGQPATWEEGDWNVDGVFDSLDIAVAQQTDCYQRDVCFSQATLSGPFGFSFDGFVTVPSELGPVQVPVSAIGQMTADGHGNITAATRSLNLGGAVILQQTAQGTYEVHPDGTGTASFTVSLAALPTVLFEPPFPLALPPATLETFSFVIDATTNEVEFIGTSIQDPASGTPLLPVSIRGEAERQ